MVAITNARFLLVEHPMYSQDHTLSDFRLFSKLKDHTFGKKFSSNEEVVEAVHDWGGWRRILPGSCYDVGELV